ncbi:MAG: cell division protein FtsA [marine benthic group bacterium]|nr:cell division protein FtsA [Candidatus Benthicola marisminoris]
MIGKPRCLAGLDVGTISTVAVLLESHSGWDTDPGPARIVGVGVAHTEGVRNRNVTHIEAATESVREALRVAEDMAGMEAGGVYAAVAGDHIEVGASSGVVAVAGDEIGQGDVDRVHEVARAIVIPPDRELLHAIPQDYTVDGQAGIQDPRGMEATRLESEVCVVTAGSPACQNLRKAIDRAGYRPEELVFSPLATSLAVLTDDQRQAGVAMLEIGGAATEMLVYREGRLHLAATLPWGGATVTNDIVKGLGIPLGDAEELKRTQGNATTRGVASEEKLEIAGPTPGRTREISRELLAHIIEQRLDEMFGLVYEALEEKQMLGALPAGVVLTGGSAKLEGTVELAQSVFNMPVALGQPGNGLDGVVEPTRDPGLSTAVGLALYGQMRTGELGGGLAVRTVSRFTDWLRDFF